MEHIEAPKEGAFEFSSFFLLNQVEMIILTFFDNNFIKKFNKSENKKLNVQSLNIYTTSTIKLYVIKVLFNDASRIINIKPLKFYLMYNDKYKLLNFYR